MTKGGLSSWQQPIRRQQRRRRRLVPTSAALDHCVGPAVPFITEELWDELSRLIPVSWRISLIVRPVNDVISVAHYCELFLITVLLT